MTTIQILPGTGRWQHEVLTEGALRAALGPLHQVTLGPPPRAGEEFSKRPHSAASAYSAPWINSSEQRRIVGLARQMALVR